MPAEGPASFRSGEVLSSLVKYLSHPGPRDKFNEFASSFVDCAIERAEEGAVTVSANRGRSSEIAQSFSAISRVAYLSPR
jgi:hypothetical protein